MTQNDTPSLSDVRDVRRMPWVVIMDIDGTLANAEHRLHLLGRLHDPKVETPPDWKAFLAAAKDDVAHREIVELNNAMSERALVFVVTGRNARDEGMTRAWLRDSNVLYDRLYMRGVEDRRCDTEVKREILDHIRGEGFEVLFAVEDRKRVTAMWREAGVRCLQVCEGEY
jgi:hypothetical protein